MTQIEVAIIPFAAVGDGTTFRVGFEMSIKGLPPHVDPVTVVRAIAAAFSGKAPNEQPREFGDKLAKIVRDALIAYCDNKAAAPDGEDPQGVQVTMPPAGGVH